MNLKTLTLAIALAAGLGTASAAQYVVGDGGSVDLSDTTYVTASSCTVQSDNITVGSTKVGSVLTIRLLNNTAGDYVLTWKGGAKNLSSTYTVAVSATDYAQNDSFIQLDTTVNGWTPVQVARLALPTLPTGEITVTLTIVSTTASAGGNFGSFQVVPAAGAYMTLPQASVAPDAAVTDGTLVLANATVKAASIESTGEKTIVNFLVSVGTKSTCGFSYKAGAKDCAATLNWRLLLPNGTQVWPTTGTTADAILDSGSWDRTQSFAHDFGTLTAGNYILFANVTDHSGSKYAGNWGDFAFTATPIVEKTYTVTAQSVERTTLAVTADGEAVTGTEGVYTVGSNANVVVTYTAIEDYEFATGETTNFTYAAICADQVVPTLEPPTLKKVIVKGTVEYGADDAYVAIAPDDNSTGSITVNDGGILSTAGSFYIARRNVNSGKNANGTLIVNGGTLSVGLGLYTGWGAGGQAQILQTGGTISLGGDFEPPYGGSTTSRVDLTGGTLAVTGRLDPCVYANASSTVTVGGSADVTFSEVRFFNGRGGSSATLSLTGGVFSVKKIWAKAGTDDAATLTLDGGTLQARESQSAFVEDNAAITFAIGSRGGTIDTQGFDVTVPAAVVGTGVNLTKKGTGTLTFSNASLFTGTITVPEGCGSVVVSNTVEGIACGTYTKCTEEGETKVFTYDYGPSYVFENGATNNTAISGRGTITINNAQMNADISEFTGIIYVNGDMYIGPNFKGAAKAKWIVQGGIYLYDLIAKGVSGTAATALQFGAITYNDMRRIYMFHGEQDCTIEIGALNQDDSIAQNDGIGGYYWNGLPHSEASVTVKKVGTGTLTSNLEGAREWIVESGAVNFVPLTQTEINVRNSNDMYQTTCNLMTVKSGATIGGIFGPTNDVLKSAGHGTLTTLSMEAGAKFVAPDLNLGYIWCVTNAYLDGITIEVADLGVELEPNTSFDLIRAYENLSAENLSLIAPEGFELRVRKNTVRAVYKPKKQGLVISFR